MKRASFLERGLEYMLTLLIALTLNFFLPRIMPGDPLALIAGDAVRQMSPDKKTELRAAYGLDESLSIQYFKYLGRLLRGDLGQSYRYSGGRSVAQVLLDRFAWTLFLVAISITLAVISGSLLGVWAAWHHGESTDLGLLLGLFTLRAVPPFWIAMLMIPIFSVSLHIFPSGDSYSIPRLKGIFGLADIAYHAAQPVMILTMSYIPIAFALMRAATLSEIRAAYITTARAKGVREFVVIYKHVLRNAMLPAVSAFILDFGQMLGGVTLIETVFNYRGLGNMMYEAVKSRDYPLLQGGFLIFTLGILVSNMLADSLYPYLDPRIRRRAL